MSHDAVLLIKGPYTEMEPAIEGRLPLVTPVLLLFLQRWTLWDFEIGSVASHPGFRQQPVFLLRTLGSAKALKRGREGHLIRTVRDLGCKPSSAAIAAWLTLAK